ncbi:MAG: hypothetical protein HKO93_05425 [Flavobacteriales bacterium]|nr:hypothetical protein [Flavobacteriales bacterium]
MTRSEKRYFKIHIRTHSSKHSDEYIQLFDMIDEQEEYDEKVLISGIKEQGSDQRFAVLKHRLFEKVLDALESYQRSNDVVMTLRHDLNKSKVLMDRGMERMALISIKKVLDKALEYELDHITLDALGLIGALESGRTPCHSNILERIATQHSISEIRKQLFVNLNSEGRMRTGMNIDTSLVEEHLLQCIEDRDAPSRSSYMAHHTLSALRFSQNRIADSLCHIDACIQLLELNEHLRTEMPLARAEMLANKVYTLCRLHDMAHAKEALDDLLGIDSELLRVHLRIAHRGILMQTLLFYLNGQTDHSFIQRLKEEEPKYISDRWEYPAVVRGAIDYGLGLFYHQKGERGMAMRFLNKILNDGEIKRDEDVYHRTLVLVTVLHAESGDREWMAHSARALKRYLKPRGLLNGVESLLLDYISDFRRARTEEGEERAMRQFVHRLRSIRRAVDERIAFEHFDFLGWAEEQLGEDYHRGMVA